MAQPHYAIISTNTVAITEYSHRLVEISILRTTTDGELDRFTTLVNPGRPIPVALTALTGIDRGTVRFEPVFCEIAEQILEILDGAILVAHGDDFAYRVLRSEFKTIGYKFSCQKVDLSQLVEKAFPDIRAFSLKDLCDHFMVPAKNMNRAEGRAEATAALFGQLCTQVREIPDVAQSIAAQQGPGHKTKMSRVEALDRKPGVYYFKDVADTIIYIGKAVRLRDRVRSHFTSKAGREIELCSKTENIDFVYTGSNLIAELLESDEIRKQGPRFNIAQKKKTTPFIVVSSENSKGYLQLSIVRKDYSDSVNEVFYNRISVAQKLIEVCTLFHLCPKFCGFHRIRGKCNHPKLTKCPAACIGEMSAEDYNQRVNQALDFLQNDLKNFAIKLKGRKNGETGFVLVRNGVYSGFGFVDMNDQIASTEDFENYVVAGKHSYHTTRIIECYIRKPRNKSNIIFLENNAKLVSQD